MDVGGEVAAALQKHERTLYMAESPRIHSPLCVRCHNIDTRGRKQHALSSHVSQPSLWIIDIPGSVLVLDAGHPRIIFRTSTCGICSWSQILGLKLFSCHSFSDFQCTCAPQGISNGKLLWSWVRVCSTSVTKAALSVSFVTDLTLHKLMVKGPTEWFIKQLHAILMERSTNREHHILPGRNSIQIQINPYIYFDLFLCSMSPRYSIFLNSWDSKALPFFYVSNDDEEQLLPAVTWGWCSWGTEEHMNPTE